MLTRGWDPRAEGVWLKIKESDKNEVVFKNDFQKQQRSRDKNRKQISILVRWQEDQQGLTDARVRRKKSGKEGESWGLGEP